MTLPTFPIEVIEMIIEASSFVDLPNILKSSKTIKAIFNSSRLSGPYKFMNENRNQSVHSMMIWWPRCHDRWTVGQVLTTYANPYCQHCGHFGYFFMWCSIPTMKLCAHCLYEHSQYTHIRVVDALEFYGLEKEDTQGYPLFDHPVRKGDHGVPRRWRRDPTQRVILRHTVESIVRNKGIALETVPGSGSPREHKFVGYIKVMGSWDRATHSHINSLICMHCPPIKIETDWYRSLFLRLWDRLDLGREIPHTYDSLHEHVSRCHPELLPSFTAAWAVFPLPLKKHRIKRAFECKRRVPEEIESWRSWADESYQSIDDMDTSESETEQTLTKRIEHAGEFFGLPKEFYAPFDSMTPNVPRLNSSYDDDLKTALALFLIRRSREEADKRLMDIIEQKGAGYFKELLTGEASICFGDLSLVPITNAVDEGAAERT